MKNEKQKKIKHYKKIIDPNNSQDFWINRRDLEIEIKLNWQVISNKYKNI